MNYDAVIFDLDGTLIDSLRDLAESTNDALRRLSLPTHDVASYRQRVGNGQRLLVSRALGPEHQDLLETARQYQQAYYAAHYADYTRPYPGVIETLAELRRHGLKMAVLSNKPDDFTRRLVTEILGDTWFDVVRGHREPTPLKPDPTGAWEMARELGVGADRIAYLGDSGVDMQTARRAGFMATGVLWGFRDRDELAAEGAQAFLERMEDLPGLLGLGRP